MPDNQSTRKKPGRPLKPRSIPDARLLRAFNMTADDPIPKNPLLLQEILKALLDRIATNNVREGQTLRAYVHYLSAFEQDEAFVKLKVPEEKNPIKRKMKKSDPLRYCVGLDADLLRLIRFPVKTKRRAKDHLQAAIQLQHSLLQQWLFEYPYGGEHKLQWWQYLEKHWGDLGLMLTIYPCSCIYKTRLETWEQSRKDEIYTCNAEGVFIHLVLANLHSCSVRTIEAALS